MRHIDVQTLDFTDPADLPAGLAIAARPYQSLRRLLHERRDGLAAALGAAASELVGSTSFRLDDEHDRSVAHWIIGEFDLFDRTEYQRVDGELVARLVEARVMLDRTLLGFVRISPDGELHVWIGDDRLRAWADDIANDLAIPPPNLLDPNPDLAGVHLGAGRLGSNNSFDLRWVEWDLDSVDVGSLAQALRHALPALFAATRLGDPPTLASRTDRVWSPMDGAEPPYCPFTDTTLDEGTGASGTSVVVRVESVHWNDDDVNNVSVALTIGDAVSISAFGPNGDGRAIRTLRLYRPTNGEVVVAVDRAVAACNQR